MKHQLLTILLFPILTYAQEVKPVIAEDYLALVNHNSVRNAEGKVTDSSNNMQNAALRNKDAYYFSRQFVIKRISVKNDNEVTLHPVIVKSLLIGGSATTTFELQHFNRLPSVQKEYVQGRSINGALAWQGPETGELFSYGPSRNTLEFDGSNYAYDVNGRLTTAGNGNGHYPIAYNNSVFRTGFLFSKDITLSFRYPGSYNSVFNAIVSAGQNSDQTIIYSNKNKSDHFSAAITTNINSNKVNRLKIDGNYNFRQQNFSNSNRSGFLNRVYQNSLLSPASFSVRQSSTIGNIQRSYSPEADNPFFLLADNGHSFLQQYHTGILSIDQRFRSIKIVLSQSFENMQEHSNESYKPGTAFFPLGAGISRAAHDNNYLFSGNVVFDIHSNNNRFKPQLSANYIYNNDRSVIKYPKNYSSYQYQRSSNDLALSFSNEYRGNELETGWVFSNKSYTSNTSTQHQYFLPGISGYLQFYSLFNIHRLRARLFDSYNRFNNELPIDKSLAAYNMLQIPVANAMQYLPVTEVSSFDDLKPIKHSEFNTGIEINYDNKVTFSATWFDRHTANDILPVMEGIEMKLVNMADHVNRGIELNLSLEPYLWGTKKIFFYSNFSFVSYRSKVTAVKDGFNNTPLAGFSDLHKALVNGEALGVIVGSTWLRDAANNIIIGANGFPIANNNPSVIGNPVPDFVMKISHRLIYKDKWEMFVDLEWKKGGDIWNGTQALLDYYGRSSATAALRNTTNYVFSGVQLNGSHNTIPVSFYDASLPIEQNRWVRYGQGGVAESYIQKGDCIRLHTIGFTYRPKMKKYLRQLAMTLYANNIVIWTPYKGADPEQLLDDQPGTSGLDFFNLPSARSVGLSVSLQF